MRAQCLDRGPSWKQIASVQRDEVITVVLFVCRIHDVLGIGVFQANSREPRKENVIDDIADTRIAA